MRRDVRAIRAQRSVPRLWLRHRIVELCLLSSLLILAGCSQSPLVYSTYEPAPSALATSTRLLVPVQVSPSSLPVVTVAHTPTPIPTDSGWQQLRPGFERRLLRILNGEGEQRESVYVLRVDPEFFRIAVAYSPGQPKTLNEWQEETEALLVINGGYYTADFKATGLTIVNGATYGESYKDFGGMLAMTESGPEVRSLVDKPFDPDELLIFALQSFPMLVNEGGSSVYSQEDGERARRTVVAQDRSGNMLFIITPWGYFTLHALSAYLVESDLEIEIALNLDGGASTGVLLDVPAEGYPAFSALPVVIVVSPK